MSSTILYKFRASSTFEALPLPGSAARLFDVKKAIVKANKLDAGSMEFDLAVRNADTNEEYGDESMLLPRGTRIIVQRLPAARGQGFLARMARNEHGGGIGNSYHQPQHPSGYYTIDNRTRENEEEEFVDSSAGAGDAQSNDDKELAALRAVTSMQPDGPTMVGGRSAMMGGHRGGRGGPPQPAGMGGPQGGSKPSFNNMANNNKPGGSSHFRPNADPELREKPATKKRATGIPRTFLSLSAPSQTDGGEGEGDQQTPLLQPNKQGFKELVSRGGGQSESTAGTRRDLDYVLKLTSTTVPDHLKCAISNTLVKNPVLLPWDSEGRTVSESLIRDALTQNGFRCPLTGIDGVSPDDLIPNVGLRKAAEAFMKDVMEKVDEIEKQQVEELENTVEETTEQSSEKNVLDGEGAEKGVIVSKRMSLSNRKKAGDDPFGADDDFGGDVFAVEAKNGTSNETGIEGDKNGQDNTDATTAGASAANESNLVSENDSNSNGLSSKDTDPAVSTNLSSSNPEKNSTYDSNSTRKNEMSTISASNNDDFPNKTSNEETAQKSPQARPQPPTSSHMRFHRRRGPPVGYSMGPAGGAVVSARANHQSNNNNSYQDHNNYNRGGRGGGRFSPRGGSRHGQYNQDRNNGGGGYSRGRGGRDRGRGNNRFESEPQDHHNMDDDDNGRGAKRSRDELQQDEGGGDGQKQRDRNGRGNFRNDGGGGRGSYGRGGGYHKGGRGGRSWSGQQRGNYRGGRGNRNRY
eukprot:CAMPEP_0116141810 /NCGR_PEP_ID=MMETSP0329-20121206/14574_1 /TAXON_ID=697910 /ORGANISM="Pseudo-nitzschia arenysensis, Strain B593" /LENGTH=746 /DNA_ID=CAMNT_0003637005 /DNA_START=348 /DNA_END=2588 /DNA_ORIENTATION=+